MILNSIDPNVLQQVLTQLQQAGVKIYKSLFQKSFLELNGIKLEIISLILDNNLDYTTISLQETIEDFLPQFHNIVIELITNLLQRSPRELLEVVLRGLVANIQQYEAIINRYLLKLSPNDLKQLKNIIEDALLDYFHRSQIKLNQFVAQLSPDARRQLQAMTDFLLAKLPELQNTIETYLLNNLPVQS